MESAHKRKKCTLIYPSSLILVMKDVSFCGAVYGAGWGVGLTSSHNSKGWYLTQFNSSNYQSFANYRELMEKATIDNIRLEEIWNDVIVRIIF